MDDLLSRVTIDPIAIKYPARGETASAGLAAQTSVSGCLGNLDGRVIALDGRVIALEGAPAPAPSGNYDVTVATALVAADVGKVVVVSSGTASIYQGGAVPAGVLVSVDGNGGGVVRRWGEATCQFGLGQPAEGEFVKANLATAKMVAAEPGSFVVFGRVLSYDGSGTGTVFVTAISTYGMQSAS